MRLNRGMFMTGAAAALVASCAPQPKTAATAPPPPAPAGAGAPVQCVTLTGIRETKVISDQVIDFYMKDGTVYRNTLPFACGGLMTNKAFGYETTLNQLCNVNTITVIFEGGGPRRGATCGLGNFVPQTPLPATAAK